MPAGTSSVSRIQGRQTEWQWYYDFAFAKRVGEELYDVRNDRDQTNNLAADPNFAKVRADLEKQLMDELQRTGDPRLVDNGKYYETPPVIGKAREDKDE